MTDLAELSKAPGAQPRSRGRLRRRQRASPRARLGRRSARRPADGRRVEAMLGYCDRPWDEPIAKLAPRYGEATPLRLAANAVMAGCQPEYFPLVMLAIEAMCEEPFNLYGVQATTHPCAPLVIVNGPVARELGIERRPQRVRPRHARQCHDRPRHPPRAAQHRRRDARLGRHVHVRGARPSITYWSPRTRTQARGSRCTSSAGFRREASTVTVVGAECPHNINDHESITAEGILTTIAGTMGSPARTISSTPRSRWS